MRRIPSLLSILLVTAHALAADEPASPASMQKFLGRHGHSDFLTFPESREQPIRMRDAIPERWTERTEEGLEVFAGKAQPGEYYVFQIGIFAHRKDLAGLSVSWGEWRGTTPIPRSSLTCFNAEGTDPRGHPLSHPLEVTQLRVLPLWFGVQIPVTARGSFENRIRIGARSCRPQFVTVRLNVDGPILADRGESRGRSLSRLAWLNSTIGTEDRPTEGYPRIVRRGMDLLVLGRAVTLSPDGLPARIESQFEPSNQFLGRLPQPLLSSPFRFVLEAGSGTSLRFVPGRMRFLSESESRVSWEVTSRGGECELRVKGAMEFDGHIEYRIELSRNVGPSSRRGKFVLQDTRLEIPFVKEAAKYMMGLGHEGGVREREWTWRWDTTKHQDALWIGDVNRGMLMRWKGENYRPPLINLYYEYGRLRLPESWGNGGRGGVVVREEGPSVLVSASTGERSLAPGERLEFGLDLLITPVKILSRERKFGDRYFHGGGTNALSKIGKADSAGANIINIHHAEDIYPFINYPYLDENVPALRHLIDSAHQRGKKLKLYYTTRELTKNLPEFWAFTSLGGEIVYPGPGAQCTTIINPRGPDPWLKEHLKEKYIPAWLNLIREGPFMGELDLAVITTPYGRLNNFYVAGLDWMVRNLGIDGIYIDDSALDRETLRRARRVIDRNRPGRIDFHTWNHFNALAGWANCMILYMDLLPYIDLTWIGEGRNYDRGPDHWLIEVSGIPYGIPGQMLEGGGNIWRGMVYGITHRAGWVGDVKVLTSVWKFWDDARFAEKLMVGYWDPSIPVTTDNPRLRATLYRGGKESYVAIGNWGERDEPAMLHIDWESLGADRATAGVSMPPIDGFQDGVASVSVDRLLIPAKRGVLLRIQTPQKKERE